jgi:hypothetical protein
MSVINEFNKRVWNSQHVVTQRGMNQMTPKERRDFYEIAVKQGCEIWVFPDALIPEVEKEFPGEELLKAMPKYLERHPESLERWRPN